MPFRRHSDEVECVRRLRDWLQILRRWIWRVVAYACGLTVIVWSRMLRSTSEGWSWRCVRGRKITGFLAGWHNLKFFAVPLFNCSLLYASVLVFWNAIVSLLLLRMPSPPCMASYSGVSEIIFALQSGCKGMAAWEFVVLTLGAFLRTVRHDATT